MNPDSALITFVLDESGSMRAIEDEARDGFNDFLDEQRNHGGDTWWTLTTFNTQPRTRFAAIPGAEVRPLGSDYRPSGMTALLDAVGSAITKTFAYLERHKDARPSDVLVVILTDGMENASQQWNRHQVSDLIREAEDAGWQFIFLGANQDSWTIASQMGMRQAAVIDFAATKSGYARAMDELSDASLAYRKEKLQQSRYRDRRTR